MSCVRQTGTRYATLRTEDNESHSASTPVPALPRTVSRFRTVREMPAAI